MKRYTLLIAWLLLPVVLNAEDKLGAEKAKMEVERRGPSVQIVDDQIRDLGEEAYFAALSIPADDSHKWFLTVVYDKKNAMTDAIKTDMLKPEAALEPWVQVKDRGKGTYDVYSTEESYMHCNFEPRVNAFKPDKWKWIKAEHCPCIVVQLPISGEWGVAGTVINQRTGYKGPEELGEWIRESIKKYTDKYSQTRGYREVRDKIRKLTGFAGHRQVGAWNPPFAVQPKDLGHGADPPSPFPPDLVPSTPPEAKPLTLEQIKAVVPDAPADFLMNQLLAKVKTPAEVQVAWLMKQLQDAKKPVEPVVNPTPAPTPPPPVVPSDPFEGRPILSWLITGGGALAILVVVLQLFGITIPGLTKKQVVVPAQPETLSNAYSDVGKQLAVELMKHLKFSPGPPPKPSVKASPDSGEQPSAS